MVTNKAEYSGELPMSTAPTVVSLNQIGQIAVTVYDLDRAFLRDSEDNLLGLMSEVAR
jgi:hypothetical protein